MMLRELSADSVTIPIRPDVPIGMKLNEAEGRLKHNEIVGAVQQDLTLLSWRERTWWSKEGEWVNVKLVTDDLKRIEEKIRVSTSARCMDC